jgi:hypothetical protein
MFECMLVHGKLTLLSNMKQQQQQCLASSAEPMKKRKEGGGAASSPWWDLFSHCKEIAVEPEDDDHHHNDMMSATADKCNGGCVATAIHGVVSILRVLTSCSNGSPDDEEEEEDHFVNTHYHFNANSFDDSCGISSNHPVDDNITVIAVTQSEDDVVPDIEEALNNETVATTLNVATRTVLDTNKDNIIDVDAALSFCVLTGILGSPALSPFVANKSCSKIENTTTFWDLDVIEGDDDIPDIQEEVNDAFKEDGLGAGLNDSCTTVSISSSDDDYYEPEDAFIVPDIDDIELQQSNECRYSQAFVLPHSVKDVADSALAWGALAMILTAPAPPVVALSSRLRGCTYFTTKKKHLFGYDEATVELDDVFLSQSQDESVDDNTIPSLAETDDCRC